MCSRADFGRPLHHAALAHSLETTATEIRAALKQLITKGNHFSASEPLVAKLPPQGLVEDSIVLVELLLGYVAQRIHSGFGGKSHSSRSKPPTEQSRELIFAFAIEELKRYTLLGAPSLPAPKDSGGIPAPPPGVWFKVPRPSV
jgi:hypothetical protein